MEKNLFERFLNSPVVIVVNDGSSRVVYSGKIKILYDSHLLFEDRNRTEFVFAYSTIIKLHPRGGSQ